MTCGKHDISMTSISKENLLFSRMNQAALPIYQARMNGQELFYAPGFLAGIDSSQVDRLLFLLHSSEQQQSFYPEDAQNHLLMHLAQDLMKAGQSALKAWQAMVESPYQPLCLTLYPHNDCNLACDYCFSNASALEPNTGPQKSHLSLSAVKAAARWVASNCLAAQQPMTVVFHGGGEPSLEMEWIEQALGFVNQIAEETGIAVFRYIATNGVMPLKKAKWLAQHFDLIGLSCDGPESIQQLQRPLKGGQCTSSYVEQTARAVHEAGKPLHVRVTITPPTALRQAEIAKYLCETLQPQEIHVEPVYSGSKRFIQKENNSLWDGSSSVEAFVSSFLQAQQIAENFGVVWKTSGSRPSDIHGPYCQVLRQVLQLVPGDIAVTCFKTCDETQALQTNTAIGIYNPHTDSMQIDTDQVIQTRRAALETNASNCIGSDCFNYYHCSRDCPDSCTLQNQASANHFRCLVNRKLTLSQLEKIAHQNSQRPAWAVEMKA
jgi:sulfatase maturation enzyme AslB (radical SAM superfamily)